MRGMHGHHHYRHSDWNCFPRGGMFFPPFLLLIGIVALIAIVITAAPWLPLLVIGFIAWRVLSQRGSFGSIDWKPKRDFSRRYWDDGETKPKRGDDSEYV